MSKRERSTDNDRSQPSKTVKVGSENQDKNNDQDLPQLLDFSPLTSLPEITLRFDRIADALLHDYHIVVVSGETRTEFQILELEFYLQKPGCHDDPFTHGSQEQKRSGRWYFHRAPRHSPQAHDASLAEYRGGSRKGMDLTIGSPADAPPTTTKPGERVMRGGTLLRTLRRVSDKTVISGPSLLVDEILRVSNVSSITELVEDKWANDISAFSHSSSDRETRMFLQRVATTTHRRPVLRSPRIGLDLSHSSVKATPSDPRVTFVSRPYRYFTDANLLTANGRIQTFVGAYQTYKGTSEVSRKREVIRLTGIKEATVVKYMKDYQAGLASGELKDFIGAKGKGASSSPATYLKMMGTLKRIQQ